MAIQLPIANPPIPPSEITGRAPNTDVPVTMLDAIDRDGANPYFMMAKLPARAMRALHGKMLHDYGIQLSTTGRTRTFDMQFNLFLQRHVPVSAAEFVLLPGDANHRRLWRDAVTLYADRISAKGITPSMYWKLKPGMAAAAVPSYDAPHVTGCCDDLAEIVNGQLVALRASTITALVAVAPAFGFYWSLTSEPWHVQWRCGDTMPAAVLDWERQTAGTPKPPEVEVVPPIPNVPVDPGQENFMNVIITIDGAYAELWAFGCAVDASGEPIVEAVHWGGPGGAKYDAKKQAHLSTGKTVTRHYPMSVCAYWTFLGDIAKMAAVDAGHAWTGDEFCFVTG